MRAPRMIATALAAATLLATAACSPSGADQTTPLPSASPPASTSASPSPATEPTVQPLPNATTASPPVVSTPAPAAPATPAASPSPEKPKPVAGPAIVKKGDTGTKVRELQARLAQLKWFNVAPTGTFGATTSSAVSGFQGKRGLAVTGAVDQGTWTSLTGMTRMPTPDELNPPANPPAKPPVAAAPAGAPAVAPQCATGRVICIDKTTRQLQWVVNGQVQSTLAVRFGSQFTPTREGTFAVNFKSKDHVSTLYNTAMPYAMFFSGGQAVHYSADFAARGYAGASHGCVNVRDRAGVAALFDAVNVGDKVVVFRS